MKPPIVAGRMKAAAGIGAVVAFRSDLSPIYPFLDGLPGRTFIRHERNTDAT